MKKLKFLTLAAIAAATAMVSSCSDNVVLEGVKDTGIPFSVTASTNSGGSRGSDITSLSNFQLWGFGLDQAKHFDGDNFTPKAGSPGVFESSVTPNWPNTNNCLFYAISDNTSDMAYEVEAGSPGVNSTKAEIRNGSFNYTIPTNVADQKDLLVAAATGNSNDGVQLKFDHALTAARLHLILDPRYTNYVDDDEPYYWYIKIRKIKICNIKTSGKYTFDGSHKDANSNYINGRWDTSEGTLGNYLIDLSSSPILIQQYKGGIADVVVGGEGNNIYFIPQIVTKWDITPNNGCDMTLPSTNSYIEFEAMAGIYAPAGVATYLQELVDANIDSDPESETGLIDPNGWTKKADGFYYNDAIVAELDGKVIDFSNEAINDNVALGEQPTMETYNFDSMDLLGTYSDLDNDDLYGLLYKPFNVTLDVNGNRNIKVSLDRAVRTDASGAFGEGSQFEG